MTLSFPPRRISGLLALEVDGSTLRIIVRQNCNYVETVWSADEAVHQIDMIRFADGSTLNAGEIAARVTPLSMPLNFMVTDVERIDGNAYANDFVDRDRKSTRLNSSH